MKMEFTKNKGMSLIVMLIILAAYNAIAFILPFERHNGFWVGYGFTMLAILLTTCVVILAFGREGLKSKFFGMPLVLVVWAYLIVQFLVGFIEMLIPNIPSHYGIVINVIVLASCLIGLIGTNIAKEEIERVEEKNKEKVFYIKSLQADVEGLITKVSDNATKKIVKDLVDTIRYSDPMSSPQLAAIENKIETKVFALTESIADVNAVESLCDELQKLFADRNRQCKILK